VTGGTRGIGAAIGHSLASQGARSLPVTAATGCELRSSRVLRGGVRRRVGVSIHQGNVSHPEDCRRVVQEVLDQHGRLDILVNNAGITIDKMAMDMTVEDWNTVLAVNLSGSFYMAQPALEHMVERGSGRIIFVSSVIARRGTSAGQLRRVQGRHDGADQDPGQGGSVHPQSGPASATTTVSGSPSTP